MASGVENLCRRLQGKLFPDQLIGCADTVYKRLRCTDQLALRCITARGSG